MRIVRANVREPIQVEGDLHALIGCNGIGEKRLSDMMTEHGIDTLDELGQRIIDKSRAGMVAAIGKLPRGTWKGHADRRLRRADRPACRRHHPRRPHRRRLAAGTSGSSIYGINSPMCYTEAYTAFGIKCVVAPTIPNNAGTLDLDPGDGARQHHRQRAVPGRGERAQHHRPHAARRLLRRPAPGDPRQGAGRGHQQPVEPEARRRPRHDRHDRQQPALHGDDLPFWRRRCAAEPRRPVGHALPVGRAQRAGRDHRDHRARGHLEEGIPAPIPAAPASIAAGWAR